MTGENIICFAKDWSEEPTSNNHVMMQLSRANRVLWLNSIATRTPKLSSSRDVRKIIAKLAQFLRGPQRVHDRLWVFTPLVLPFPFSPLVARLNVLLLRATLAVLRRRLRMREFQLWTFLPNAADYIGKLGESVVVYYCVDEWSGFSYLDAQRTQAAEEALCRRADIVFGTSSALVDSKKAFNPETHLATHGVDYELFAKALDPTLPLPEDVADLAQPVLGFYGTIQYWVDLSLIAFLAERRPEWSIVVVGSPMVDVSCLSRHRNVLLLGRRDHADLPAYCRSFAVGLIPYVIDDHMPYVNPIKLREYLCAGLPVVSTPIPEVTRFPDFCAVADSHEAFEEAVSLALASDSPELRRMRSDAMRSETWERKVAEVSSQVMRVKASKCRA